MLNIENVNHIGIRIAEKKRSVAFYETLGFAFLSDAGFEEGHPIIIRHPGGVTLNLLGPSNTTGPSNILMDVEEKHTGITHFALTVASLDDAKRFVTDHDIEITGQFSFKGMSAIFIRDPDRNVIELDAFAANENDDGGGYRAHP